MPEPQEYSIFRNWPLVRKALSMYDTRDWFVEYQTIINAIDADVNTLFTTRQKTFEVRGGSKHTTASASAGGGTVSDNIPIGGITAGAVCALRVKALGDTIDLSLIHI